MGTNSPSLDQSQHHRTELVVIAGNLNPVYSKRVMESNLTLAALSGECDLPVSPPLIRDMRDQLLVFVVCSAGLSN